MTRAAEFCYIAERKDGAFLLGGWPTGYEYDARTKGCPGSDHWTKDPEMALRITADGRTIFAAAMPEVGFRKILAG